MKMARLLKEFQQLAEFKFKEKDLEKINEYIERLQKIAMEMQTTATEVNDVEKNFRKDIEEINKKLEKKAEELK